MLARRTTWVYAFERGGWRRLGREETLGRCNKFEEIWFHQVLKEFAFMACLVRQTLVRLRLAFMRGANAWRGSLFRGSLSFRHETRQHVASCNVAFAPFARGGLSHATIAPGCPLHGTTSRMSLSRASGSRRVRLRKLRGCAASCAHPPPWRPVPSPLWTVGMFVQNRRGGSFFSVPLSPKGSPCKLPSALGTPALSRQWRLDALLSLLCFVCPTSTPGRWCNHAWGTHGKIHPATIG